MKLLQLKDIVKFKNTFTRVTNVRLYDDDFKARVELERKDGKVVYPLASQIKWNGKQWIVED